MLENQVRACKEAVVTAYTKVNEAYNSLGRKITVLTNKHLPSPLNQVAQEVYWGLPYSAALFLVPAPLGIVAATLANIATYVLLRKNIISSQFAERIFMGVRNFCVAQVVIEAIKCNPAASMSYAILGFASQLNIDNAHEYRYRLGRA